MFEYKVERNRFRVIIRGYNRNNKEVIVKRLASTKLECSECYNIIQRGEFYIRDKFFWCGGGYEGRTKVKTNFICLGCWKGEIPVGRDKNWFRSKDV